MAAATDRTRQWGAPRPAVRLARGARPEMREDPVDHRAQSDERDDPHGAMAGRARQRVDSKFCCKRAAHWRVASVGASRGTGTIRGIGCGGIGLTPLSAQTVGVPAVVPRGDAARVRIVREDRQD